MTKERSLAMMVAERMVAERKLRIPIDPFELARDEQIEVFEKPAAGGVSGMLMRVGDDFLIAYAAHLDNEGFQRFSVAHELGHYFLEGHIEHVLGPGDVHESRAGFTSKAPHELEADQFAAGLLLPTAQFRTLVQDSGDGLSAIERLAGSCRTSLTATAIRYAQCNRDPVAIVVCSQDDVAFCFMSDSFKELKGLNWLHSKEPIPRNTATYALAGDPSRIVQADRVEELVHIHDWFGGGPDVQLVEEVVGLGRYGKILTVLTPQALPDEEEREEDESLIASWTPTFSRSRKR